MTIDPLQFEAGLAMLAKSLGNATIDPPTTRFYYSVLNPVMTTEQFTQAIQLASLTERFWPSPGVLLDKVMPPSVAAPKPADTAKLEGGTLFDRIQRECGEYSPYGVVIHEEAVRQLAGEAAVMAFRAIGGTSRYRTLTETSEPWARREFADAYATAVGTLIARGDLQLSGPTDSRVVMLTALIASRLALPSRTVGRHDGSGTPAAPSPISPEA